MVAKITTPKSIEATLNYNEKKVQRGDALCLIGAIHLKKRKGTSGFQRAQTILLNEKQKMNLNYEEAQ